MDALSDLTIAQLTSINNDLADLYDGDSFKKLSKFSSVADGAKRVGKLLEETGEKVVRLVQPDYIKRGKAAERFPLYTDGMLASKFVDLCKENGHTQAEARADLRYDAKRGLINLIAVG